MLEVIAGCMYSGKSEELTRRLRRCQIAGQRVLALKPACDDRYSAEAIATHTGDLFQATSVASVDDLASATTKGDFDVLGVDEAQFFESTLTDLLESLANQGYRVIVAGLDLDSNGNPFGPIPDLLAKADTVTKLSAVCVAPATTGEGKRCGKQATRSYRIPQRSSGKLIQVGSTGVYEARCRICWVAGQ